MENYKPNDDEKKKKNKSYWRSYKNLDKIKLSEDIENYLSNLNPVCKKSELRNRKDFENKLCEAIEECREKMPREWKIICENPEEYNFENWLVKNGYETITKASKFHGGLTKALCRATENRMDVNVYQKIDMMVI